MKSHITKLYSKKQEIRDSSAFRKHLHNSHGGVGEEEKFEDLFEVEIIKAYSKPMTRQTEEGTFMININGELLNSKTEWHQPKIIRTTIHTGGAELAGGMILSLPSSLPPFPLAGVPGTQRNGNRANPAPLDGASGTPGVAAQTLRRSSRNTGR